MGSEKKSLEAKITSLERKTMNLVAETFSFYSF